MDGIVVWVITVGMNKEFPKSFSILISNKFIDIKKGSTLVHRECTRGQTIKNKNYKNLGNQEKMKMIGSAM